MARNRVQLLRGLKTHLPTLYEGEPGYCTDTGELYLGTQTGNKCIGVSDINSQLPDMLINAKKPPAPLVGVVGGGIIDDTTAFTNLLSYCKQNQKTLFVPLDTYKLSSNITIYADKQSVVSNGATLDFSSLTTGVAITIDGVNTDINSSPKLNHKNKLSGFTILGSTTYANTTGIEIKSSTSYASFFRVEDCYIQDFGVNVTYNSNAWCNTFERVVLKSTNGKCIYAPSGGTNYGERMTFIDCTFFNSNIILDHDNSNGNMQFIGCSFDYSKTMFDISGGCVFVTNSHIESNLDTDYWIKVSGDGRLLSIENSQIVVSVNKANYEIGTINSSVLLGGVHITDCMISIPSYSKQSLFAGTGRVKISGLTSYSQDSKPTISESLNLLADGHFTAGNISEWTLGGTSNPTYDGTVGYTANGSLKMAVVTNGQDGNASVTVDLKPSQRALFSFMIKASGLTASSKHLYITAKYLNAKDTVLSTVTLFDVNADCDWTLKKSPLSAPPVGTTKVQFIFNTGATVNTAICWIDDVIINII